MLMSSGFFMILPLEISIWSPSALLKTHLYPIHSKIHKLFSWEDVRISPADLARDTYARSQRFACDHFKSVGAFGNEAP